MTKLDRRAVLKSLAAATTAPFVPGCQEGTPGPTASSVQDVIDHVVILMMENRSFDTFLGAYSLEGRTDVDGLTAAMSNFGADGTEHLVHPADIPCVFDPPHSWGKSHDQWNGGMNDGFVRAHETGEGAEQPHTPMQYWTRKTLAATYALGDRYTICDRWFCSVLGPTWPNRFYAHAASSNGYPNNEITGDYTMPTIYQALDRKGISWGCYHLTAPLMIRLPGHFSSETFHDFDRFLIDAQYGQLPAVTVIEPFYGRADDHPPAHPLAGQILIAQVYQALAASPLWGRIQFFITYDEHGGFFDHVPPPTFPDDRADQGFGQGGFRVPSLAIGPYVKQGVSSTVYDHTSMLAFIEALFDVDPLNQRDGSANNLFDVLDEERVASASPAAPITLPVIEADEEVIYADECVTGAELRDDHGLLGQPEFEAWLDALPMQHPLDNRDRLDRVYEQWLATAESMGVWRRV